MLLPILVIPVMIYAGYKDMKNRIIPDKVHIMLILIGVLEMLLLKQSSIFYLSVSERIVGLVPAATLFFIYIINQKVGGGDFKLVASTGFCLGFHGIMIILLISCAGGIIALLVKNQKSIPLAFYMAIGTILYFPLFLL